MPKDAIYIGPAPWAHDDSEGRARAMPRIALGIVLSLLLHALLFIFMPKPLKVDVILPPPPLEVRLSVPLPPPIARAEPPKVKLKVSPLADQVSSIVVPTKPPVNPQPRQAPPSDQPQSMAEFVARKQALRLAEEEGLARYNAAGRVAAGEMTDKERRSANLADNIASLKPGAGARGGEFAVKAMGHRTAQVAFETRGNDGADKHHEFEVDAGQGGDVELAIIRGVIKEIRKNYQSDFIWNSHRLGRVITKSARVEDNDELEQFLMIEFGFRKVR